MTRSKEIALLHQQIRIALDAGRAWDRISDAAFAIGNVDRGTYAGNVAIASYTRAERFSLELNALQS